MKVRIAVHNKGNLDMLVIGTPYCRVISSIYILYICTSAITDYFVLCGITVNKIKQQKVLDNLLSILNNSQ